MLPNSAAKRKKRSRKIKSRARQLKLARKCKGDGISDSRPGASAITQNECIQSQAISDLYSSAARVPEDNEPPRKRSRSELKLLRNSENTDDLDCEEDEDSDDLKEYCFMDLSILNSVIKRSSVCKICKVGSLQLLKVKKSGLAKKLFLKCCSCGEINAFYTSKMNVKVTRKTQRLSPFEVNTRFMIAMRMLGKGLKGMQTFCGNMNMTAPMKQNTYTNLLNKIKEAVDLVAENSMKTAAEEISQTQHQTMT